MKERITFDEMPQLMADLVSEVASLRKELIGLKIRSTATPVHQHRPIGLEEACRIVGKAKNTLYRYTAQGLIPHYKKGKSVYFFEDELIEWLRKGYCKTIDEKYSQSDKVIVRLTSRENY